MRANRALFATLLVVVNVAAAAELKPVTVSVVDDQSGAPVKEFTYQFWYEAPGLEKAPNGDAWTRVASPGGTFEIQAPISCRLFVMAKAADYVERSRASFVIRSTDLARRVVVRLPRGVTVKGTVREAQTGRPVAGAVVAPMLILGHQPDQDKAVKTGADGRYEVRGVDPVLGTIDATHPDYDFALSFLRDKPRGADHDLLLRPKAATPELSVTVVVVDTSGNPIEGAICGVRRGKHNVSGKDGRLTLLPNRLNGLTIAKEGFSDRKVDWEEAFEQRETRRELVVGLEPVIPLTGRVVGPDGRPVAAYVVAAGPGKLAARSNSFRRRIKDGDGRFRLELFDPGTTWVGVAAPGFAAWEGWVEHQRGGQPLEVRLSPGVTVTGRIVVPEALGNRVTAKLVPRRDKSDIGGMPSRPYAEEFPTRAAIHSADGTIRFEHVRPDRYRLLVGGDGIPETALAVDVPAAGLHVGTLRIDVPTATGRIEGQVWHPERRGRGPWAFAKGYVGRFRSEGLGDESMSRLEFQADEDGRFVVEGVPVGLAKVGFPVRFIDVIDTYTWSARVVAGETTRVRAFDPGSQRQFTLAFAIGDGSRAQYESGTGLGASRKVEGVTVTTSLSFGSSDKPRVTPREPRFGVGLEPQSKGPLAFQPPGGEELDAQRKAVLSGVEPGRYRLRVNDVYGGPLFDRDVVVPEGGRGEVRIELGAGCITGKVPAPESNYGRPVKVTAVAKGSSTLSWWTNCDDDGNFCVRYLPPGTYTLFIRDPKAGFCRVDDVKVGAGVVDIGERRPVAGATIECTIRFARPSPVPDEVVAVGPSGVSVRWAFEVYSSFDRAVLPALWPGRWTVSAQRGGKVLALGEVDVEATGAFPVTLTAAGSGLEP